MLALMAVSEVIAVMGHQELQMSIGISVCKEAIKHRCPKVAIISNGNIRREEDAINQAQVPLSQLESINCRGAIINS